MRDAAVEGPAQDRPARLVRVVAAEVVPEPERDRGQLQAARAASAGTASCRSGRRRRRRAWLGSYSLGRAQTTRLRCAVVFDSLSDKLQSALGDLRKKGSLDEEAISRAMREIRLALLEADVNFTVVRDFVARVREQALGEAVLKSLTPGPAGREDRPRRADAADGRGRVGPRVRQVHGHPARRPPGLGQDDDRRQARAAPAQPGAQARPDRGRPAASRRDRPARAARRADSDPGLPHRHEGRGRGDAQRPRPRARSRARHRDRRHRRPPADRRGADGRARARARRGEAAERDPRRSTR